MPLLEAIQAGDLPRIHDLISVGADLHETDENDCFTALGHAAYLGHIQIVRALLDAAVALDDSAFACPLAAAALGGQVEAARILIEAGASLDWQDETGMTPLMHAARVGQIGVVQYLVECGADLERRDYYSRYGPRNSALDYAVDGGHPEVAVYLLARGAHFEPADYLDESGAAPNDAHSLIELAHRNRTTKKLRDVGSGQ